MGKIRVLTNINWKAKKRESWDQRN